MKTKLFAVLFVFIAAAGARAQSPDSVQGFHERGAARFARGDFIVSGTSFSLVGAMPRLTLFPFEPR